MSVEGDIFISFNLKYDVMDEDNKVCFVIMGFGKKTDLSTGKTFDLDQTYKHIIKPAAENAGYLCVRGDEVIESGIIDKSMFGLLIRADLVIADISTFNPNAIYELGIRHAVKPFSTIVMKNQEGDIPFDINRVKIFHYQHEGNFISAGEADEKSKQLQKLIASISVNHQTDSPLFFSIPSAEPSIVDNDTWDSIIEAIAQEEKSLFAISERAKKLTSESKMKEAAVLWGKSAKMVEDNHYYIQQHALCTYKSQHPNKEKALLDALSIINQLDPQSLTTKDPETLGIAGAINKELWELDKSKTTYLKTSEEYYKRGFQINNNYYTGENYALCINWEAQLTEDEGRKQFLKYLANDVRQQIIEIIENLLAEEDAANSKDVMWAYATMANSQLALGKEDKYKKYRELFMNKVGAEWQKDSFEKGIERLNNALK